MGVQNFVVGRQFLEEAHGINFLQLIILSLAEVLDTIVSIYETGIRSVRMMVVVSSSRSSRRHLNVLLERTSHEQQQDTLYSARTWNHETCKVDSRSMMVEEDVDDETYMNYDMQV